MGECFGSIPNDFKTVVGKEHLVNSCSLSADKKTILEWPVKKLKSKKRAALEAKKAKEKAAAIAASKSKDGTSVLAAIAASKSKDGTSSSDKKDGNESTD